MLSHSRVLENKYDDWRPAVQHKHSCVLHSYRHINVYGPSHRNGLNVLVKSRQPFNKCLKQKKNFFICIQTMTANIDVVGLRFKICCTIFIDISGNFCYGFIANNF